MGYRLSDGSTGRWEGDTRVVLTNGLNDKTFSTARSSSQRVHADDLTLPRRDIGRLDVEITFRPALAAWREGMRP